MMHGNTKLKFIDAKQAKDFFKYKNTKRKLYKVNSAIWYNKTCKLRKLTPNLTQFNKSGIYKLSCMTCNKAYIGQTNRNIAIRYNEHKIHKVQQPPIRICGTHPQQQARIWQPPNHHEALTTYKQTI